MLPFSKTLSETGWILMIGFWIFLKVKHKTALFKLDAVNASYLLFMAVVVLSLTQTCPDLMAEGLRGVWKWAKYLLIFWMCRDLFREPANAKRVTTVFLVSMALVSLNGFWQMWQGVDWIKGYPVDIPGRLVRMRSSFGSPNDLAGFYALALPLSFGAWIAQKKWSVRSAGLAVLTAVFFTGLVLTLSRSAFFALCAAAFIFFAATAQKKIILLGAAALALFLGSQSLIRENFILSLNPRDITVGERLDMWRQSVELIKEKPILGHGANTYYKEHAAHAAPSEEYRGYAHNFILQLASDLGLLGLALFLFPLGYGLIKKKPAALWVGLAAFVIQGLWDTNFFAFQTSHLFWVFWGMFLSEG